MCANFSVTGENLHEDSVNDSIPGATPFFKVDLDGIDEDGKYQPLDRLPSNPHEYLKSVMLEARNTPSVVVAKIDPSKFKTKSKLLVHSKFMKKPDVVRKEILPSRTWQETQLADFASAREEYVRHLAKLKSISRQTKKRPKLPIYPLPPWDDEQNWKFLCFGNNLRKKKNDDLQDTEVSENNSSLQDEDCDEEMGGSNGDLGQALAASGKTTVDILAEQMTEENYRTVDLKTLEEGFPPMMRILLRMDANQVEANLEYHAHWLDEYGFSHEQGRWIYALLTCLEKPLFPTVISCLRDLSRKCTDLRTKLVSSDDVHLNGLNLIICIVGRYYDQTDLADPW